jgi:hypothetical protein
VGVKVHESWDHKEAVDIDLAATFALDSADVDDLAIGDTDVGSPAWPSGAINDVSVAKDQIKHRCLLSSTVSTQ